MEAKQQVLKEGLNDQKSRVMAIPEQMQQRCEYQFRSQLRGMEANIKYKVKVKRNGMKE